MMDVNWLCKNGYPNKVAEERNNYIKKVQDNLLKELQENNFKVNRRKFDEIISAGLFDDLSSQLGNSKYTYDNVYDSLGKLFNTYKYNVNGFIEGFDDEETINHSTDKNYYVKLIIFIIVLFICLYAYAHYYY